jgi:hypothetical protein
LRVGGKLYKVIEESLEWERVNGEVIVISFNSGKYFSLSGSAADVWHLFLTGISEVRLAKLVSTAWSLEHLNSEELSPFIKDCLNEGLVEEISLEESNTFSEFPADLNRSHWTAPHLMTFGNLKDLIMVDPVHDASLINWPLPGDAKP